MPIKYAFVNTDGVIESILTPGYSSMIPDRTYDQGRLVVHIDSMEDNEVFTDTKTWDFTTSMWEAREAPPDEEDNEWDKDTRTWKRNRVRIRRKLREIRNRKLQACDWTQLLDAPITPQRQALWALYRTQLREVPKTYKNVDRVKDAVWPTPPGA